MSKDQVSGSLTLSLSGLADAVAERVAEEVRAAVQPQRPEFLSDQEAADVLSGHGALALNDTEAMSLAASLRRGGYGLVQILGDPVVTTPIESPVAWFEREVAG